MQVIGLCGPAGAGKSTVATLLMGQGFEVVPFAKPLKDMLRVLGVPEACLTGTPEQKESPLDLFGGKSARYAMQTLGTEWGRNCIASDFWARAWLRAVQCRVNRSQSARLTLSAVIKGIVADDVRFQQEVDAIRMLGGRVVCVVRSDEDFSRRPEHASENFAAIKPDIILKNDGSLADLRQKVVRMQEPIPPPLRKVRQGWLRDFELPPEPWSI